MNKIIRGAFSEYCKNCLGIVLSAAWPGAVESPGDCHVPGAAGHGPGLAVQYRTVQSTVQYSTAHYSTDLAGVAGHHVHRDEEEAEEVQQPRALHHQEVAVADVDKSE